MKSPLARLGYANVMSTLAFFLALGGTTIAATKIDGGDIKRNSIEGRSLAKETIAGKKIKLDAVKGAQVLESTLAEVPAAAAAGTAANAATAADAQRVGGKTAIELTDDCPAATRPYAGACFESADRTAMTWTDAAETCGDAGRRLPALDELEGFRQELGVTLDPQGEHTSTFIDANAPSAGGFLTALLVDSGAIQTGAVYGTTNAAFRCVAPLSNR